MKTPNAVGSQTTAFGSIARRSVRVEKRRKAMDPEEKSYQSPRR
jgi:hypothetical protein